jgi:lipid-A-disaccharide synthase-like uncharacterized protein
MDLWVLLGFAGQTLFGVRILIQWICSERRKESYIPNIFWYCSLSGGIILLIYAIHRRDIVFSVGQAFGVVVYVRNLYLIYSQKNPKQSSLS